jgi:arylsulfatase A-like enzyme
MPNRYAIVIAVDGLRASALGAYGNTWHPTPSLDRLASESVVFDWMIADSPQLAGFYRAAWFGVDPPRDGVERDLTTLEAASSVANGLASQRVQLALTTDDQWLAEQADQLGFGEVRGLEFAEPATADAVADTELAQLFGIAADQIEHWQAAESDASLDDAAPQLLWIHARGYHGAWDAPLELRQSLLDEEDPAPSENVVPPSRLQSSDHDELLLHRAAYAAQTIILDECVGILLEALQAAGVADNTLVALVGCRGFALGEHGVVGKDACELYSEITHLPLLVRLPGSGPAPPPRMGNLTQPCDLGPILLRWFEASEQDAGSRAIVAGDDAIANAPRITAFSVGSQEELAVRTDSWALRRFVTKRPDGTEAPAVELFSKPDDRWEANEIANRCPEEAASLLAIAEDFIAHDAVVAEGRD